MIEFSTLFRSKEKKKTEEKEVRNRIEKIDIYWPKNMCKKQ